MGFSSRCIHSKFFGSLSGLPGAQAQYIRVYKAGGTLIKLDDISMEGVRRESMLLLADILPTGYHAVNTVLQHTNLSSFLLHTDEQLSKRDLVLGIIGLGPVGLVSSWR